MVVAFGDVGEAVLAGGFGVVKESKGGGDASVKDAVFAGDAGELEGTGEVFGEREVRGEFDGEPPTYERVGGVAGGGEGGVEGFFVGWVTGSGSWFDNLIKVGAETLLSNGYSKIKHKRLGYLPAGQAGTVR